MEDRIVRERERARLTGLSRTTWWALERAGDAPPRRRLGPGSVGWLLSELQEWISGRDRGGLGPRQRASPGTLAQAVATPHPVPVIP